MLKETAFALLVYTSPTPIADSTHNQLLINVYQTDAQTVNKFCQQALERYDIRFNACGFIVEGACHIVVPYPQDNKENHAFWGMELKYCAGVLE